MIGFDGLAGRRSGHFLGTSINLDAGAPWSSSGFQGYKLCVSPRNGIDADGRWQCNPAFAHWSESGSSALKNPLWDKIIVVPTSQDLGAVLSQRNFQVEVWSTYRDRQQTLTGIVLSGPGNMILTDSYGLPLVYQPEQSRVYSVSLPGQGDPTIANVATFTFSGLQPAAFIATGLRVAVFWPAMDWSESFRETPQWKTSILPAYSGAEQRIQLRHLPRYQVSFRILTLSEQQTAALEAQLHFQQPALWGVPWWTEQSYLSASVIAGALILPVDTTYRPTFVEDGLVLIWTDAFTWEVGLIDSISDIQITLVNSLTKSWPTGAKVVPMRKGRLSELSLGRPTNWLSAATFTFSCEAGPSTISTWSGTTYLGFDVLVTSQNAREESVDTFQRSTITFDPGVGSQEVTVCDEAPKVSRSYLWTSIGKAAIIAMRSWLEARKGQKTPFWISTWRRDFILATDVGANDTSIVIKAIGYTHTAYQHKARRHLVFFLPSGLMLRGITNAIETGATETLTLSAAPGVVIPKETLVSYLLLCRLSTDEPEIIHLTDAKAECTLPYLEVPEEAP